MNTTEHESNESKYADNFNFSRTHRNYFTLLVNIQLSITNLQIWCSKWQILSNISKKYYLIFYDKKKLPPPPDISVTIDQTPLARVKEKRTLGIVTDWWTTQLHTTYWTNHLECRSAYNRLNLYPDLVPGETLRLYKGYIRSRLEYGCIIWGWKFYQKIICRN